jgi:DNA-binding response OmpR family regulator
MRPLVLVVDDSPEVRTFLALWLSSFGCDVRTVESGEAAQRELTEEIPDLILLDILLPGLNGFDVCERLKGHITTSQIPVVIMSGLRQPANKRRARELGAKYYLMKPFDERELVTIMGSIVGVGDEDGLQDDCRG